MQPNSVRYGRLGFTLLAMLSFVSCTSAKMNNMPGNPSGSGTVTGSVSNLTYDQVQAAYIIAKPDDPARTTVIYVFDTPISCGEITQAGWDETVPDQSQSIEIKLIGQAAGDYPIAADGRPSSGEADVNYTLTSTSGTPSEVSATAGSVVLDTIDGVTSATGSFELTIPGGSLSGTFSAAACPDGREP